MKRIIYWVTTGLICLIFGFGVYNYFFNHQMIAGFFVELGFPTWLIYPMAVAKILGILAILIRLSPLIIEWAYAGLFFNATLAISAHLAVGDGKWLGAGIALVAVLVSRALLDSRSPAKSTVIAQG